jgi:DNA replication protein DnaC
MQTIAQATAAALANAAASQESPTKADAGPPWRPEFDAYEPSLQRAADKAAKFIADMGRGASPYWLTLSGIHGTGKTMLARQIFAQAKRHNPGDRSSIWVAGTGVFDPSNRRPRCVWYHAHDFADTMKGGVWDLPEYLRADFLVVLDDLGAARDKSDFLSDAMYRLAEQRMHRWTIWTTNLTLDEIGDRLDARISSRLVRDENVIVGIKAGDYAMTGRRAA